jgi:hypothetical protein
MSQGEILLYWSQLRSRTGIVEFGCGGSTLLALQCSRAKIYSVESDRDWIDHLLKHPEVSRAVENNRLSFHHSDLGQVAKWGFPSTLFTAQQAASYYSTIWDIVNDATIDLVLVDGRFRVACIAEALRRHRNITIVVHDFWDRPYYHYILPALFCIDRIDTLGVFAARTGLTSEILDRLLLESQLDPR